MTTNDPLNRRLHRRTRDGEPTQLKIPYVGTLFSKIKPKPKQWRWRWSPRVLAVIALLTWLYFVVKRILAGDPYSSFPLLIHLSGSFVHPDQDGLAWFIGSRDRLIPEAVLVDDNRLPDYGGLVFVGLKHYKFQRWVRQNDLRLYHDEKRAQYEISKEHITKRHWFDDELEDYETDCRRPNWENLHFPICNAFHEIDLSRNFDAALATRSGDRQDGDSFYLSHGYFRDVFALKQLNGTSAAVLKVARYSNHELNYRAICNAKRDALIMERLTSSPNIIDIYGHCGASVMVESMPAEVESSIVPGGGWMSQEDLHDSKDVDIQNEFEVSEKLQLALEMAESIAELHGFKDGVIVHDDIQLCQWLRNDQGKLKLGDFNRARVLSWNDEKQEYCKYNNGKSYGNYRSPQEYAEKDLSQQHDVWSFGNNIYALLTGLWVFYDTEDDEVVAQKLVNGSLAFIDERYRTRSFIEGRLVEIMERCWVYDMDERADIFEVAQRLRQTLKESKEHPV